MNKRIIYQNDQGGVSVVIPAPNCGLTIEEIAAKDVPTGKPYKIVDVSEIPTDRSLRNGWKCDNANNPTKIEHDIPKCREIWKDYMRAVRKPLLEALDADWMKAVENDDTAKKNEVKTKKQELRDVTTNTDLANATTPAQIKAVWPTCLGSKPSHLQ